MHPDTLLDFCLVEEVDNEYLAMHSLTRYVLWELLVEDYRFVAERVVTSISASAPETFKEEIDELVVREGEYFFEQPIFYEVADVCCALARLNSIIAHELGKPKIEKIYRDDLTEAQGKIAIVAAYACARLTNLSIEKVTEPLSGDHVRAIVDHLRELREEKERFEYAPNTSSELFEEFVGDLSDPKNIELLGKVYKVAIPILPAKGLIAEDSAQAYLLDAMVFGMYLVQRRLGGDQLK